MVDIHAILCTVAMIIACLLLGASAAPSADMEMCYSDLRYWHKYPDVVSAVNKSSNTNSVQQEIVENQVKSYWLTMTSSAIGLVSCFFLVIIFFQ